MSYRVRGGWACLHCGSVFASDEEANAHQNECRKEKVCPECDGDGGGYSKATGKRTICISCGGGGLKS